MKTETVKYKEEYLRLGTFLAPITLESAYRQKQLSTRVYLTFREINYFKTTF